MSLFYFNPRTPVGCDKRVGTNLVVSHVISIHAPQWGATITEYCFTLLNVFQSTHPSGVRRDGARGVGRDRVHFNPRTPVGCDLDTLALVSVGLVFQSTHPSGVRHAAHVRMVRAGQFQSTHPSGVRRRWPCRS